MGSSTGNAFDRLRLEAKCFLKDVRRGDEAATRRFTQYWPDRPHEARNLARAQLVIAREHGYQSWAHLKTSLLGNEESVMSEQKPSMASARRLGVYTHAEAEALLGISEDQIRHLAEKIAGRQTGFLTATLLEKIWVSAKPFMVYPERVDGLASSREDRMTLFDAVLGAGALVTMHMAQLRFATSQEAERQAALLDPIPGYRWVVEEAGLDKLVFEN